MFGVVLRTRLLAFAPLLRGPRPSRVSQFEHGYPLRFYTRTLSAAAEDGDGDTAVKVKKKKKEMDPRAIDYNRRRDAYLKEVSKLRKQYFAEAVANKEADNAERARHQRELTRKKLERMRLRNIRSGQNALRQEEMRKEQAKRFEQHLAEVQARREARDERFRKARQIVIDEMEKEAPLWLSTPEEIEAAFTPDAMQKLWGRRHGVLGSPNPSLDSHFWNQESHFYKMPKSPKPQRQWLFERVEEMIYHDANIDPKYWTKERVAEAKDIEDRARLRSDVQVAGRRELLKRQAQMIDQQSNVEEGEAPKQRPAPNLKFLANTEALEAEGSKILLEDPTKFFVFDERSGVVDEKSKTSRGKYVGPTLGSPTGYKRIGANEFPVNLGSAPGPDKRTQKEKKQQERERRLRAAAESNLESKIEMEAEDTFWESLPDVDYDNFRDPDAIAWEKSIDKHTEEGKAILEVPDGLRMKQEDVDWAKDQLVVHQDYYEKKMRSNIESIQVSARSSFEYEKSRIEGYVETPEDKVERIVYNLPYEQLMRLANLERQYIESPLSDEEISEAAEEIPNLTKDQIKDILTRDRTLEPEDPKPKYKFG